MLIERTERGLKIRTPAKLNLFLDVLGKRTDGYHQIDTIMCPVGLLDELEFEPTESPQVAFSLADGHDPAWEIPTGESNLVVRALGMVRERVALEASAWQTAAYQRGDSQDLISSLAARSMRGCRVRLTKRIPAAAGLGGGSSDAAAAIVAGLWMWSMWDRQLAVDIASRLGSDIPLFLGDQRNGIGLARATGRGEHVEILTGRPPFCFVISHPPVGSSTAEVYKLWRDDRGIRSCTQMLDLLSGCASTTQPGPLHRTDGSTQSREIVPAERLSGQELCRAFEPLLVNALQRPASQLNPWIDKQLALLSKLEKPVAMMSGSGSACFALCSDLDEGRNIVEKLIELGMPRAYAAPAWYAASIEQQLERITNVPVPTN